MSHRLKTVIDLYYIFDSYSISKSNKTMPTFVSDLLIIIGFIFSVFGMIVSPHIFHNLIRNAPQRKAISFASMLPGVLILSLGFYLS